MRLANTASQHHKLARTNANIVGEKVDATRLFVECSVFDEGTAAQKFAHVALVLQQHELLVRDLTSLNTDDANHGELLHAVRMDGRAAQNDSAQGFFEVCNAAIERFCGGIPGRDTDSTHHLLVNIVHNGEDLIQQFGGLAGELQNL